MKSGPLAMRLKSAAGLKADLTPSACSTGVRDMELSTWEGGAGAEVWVGLVGGGEAAHGRGREGGALDKEAGMGRGGRLRKKRLARPPLAYDKQHADGIGDGARGTGGEGRGVYIRGMQR